ncbi:hypothetical protein GCM10027049_15630 [Mucilaginibacter puniceus]
MEALISPNRYHCREEISENLANQLAKIDTLEVIQFHDIKPSKKTLQNLNDLVFKQRKDITLRVYGARGTWKNINFLRDLPELEKFDWHSDEFTSMEPLYTLNKLVHFGIGYGNLHKKTSVTFLSDFKDTLKSIYMDGDYKDFVTTVPKLSNLSSIWLMSMKLKNFDFLSGLPIETLANYGGRVGDFSFVSQLKTIKHLWIKTNATLKEFDFISELPELKIIELLYVSKLIRFPKCDHLNNLEKIFAFECNRLVDISEVQKLKNCKIFLSGKSIPGRSFEKDYD